MITTNYVDVEPKAVVYFDEHEPDYGKYKRDRMAKEAQSGYTPVFHSVITIEEYEKLPQVIAEKEAEAKRKAEKDEIINAILSKVPAMMEEKQKEADATAYAKNLALIEKINGRKYKFAFQGKKYETYEQAELAVKESSKNTYYENKSDLAYCMKYAKE